MRAHLFLVASLVALSGCLVDTSLAGDEKLTCGGDADCPSDRTCVAGFCLTKEQLATPAVAFASPPAFADGEGVRSDHEGKDTFHIDVHTNVDADVRADCDIAVTCASAGAAHATCTGTVAGADAEGVHGITVVATDAFGRTAEAQLSLIVDKTAPTATLLATNIVRNGVQRAAAGDGSIVTLTFATDEDAEVSVAGGPPGDEPFDTTNNGRLATAVLTVDAASTAAGARAVKVTATDGVGNALTVQLDDAFTVDFDAPGAPDVDTPGSVVLTRAPWGKDGGAPFTRVDAAAGAVEQGAGLVVTSDEAGASVLDVIERGGDGSFSAALPAGDLADVFVRAVDAAGNVGDGVAVREGVWIAVPARPAGSPQNPVEIDVAPHFGATLVDDSMVAVDAAAGAGAPGGGTLPARTAGDWRQRVFPAGPPARFRPGVASDVARGVAIVFGGLGASGPLFDTWAFDGEVWAQRAPQQHPPARSDAAMAYDAAAGVTVLFGGDGGGAPLDDLWFFDGVNWTPVDTGDPRPDGRSGARMAFSGGADGALILFGGAGADGHALSDTWKLDTRARRWTQLTTSPVPARKRMALGFDEAGERAVMFGGVDDTGAPLGDTWIFDAAAGDWVQSAGTGAPPAQGDAALTFVRHAGALVLAGNNNTGAIGMFALSADGQSWSAQTFATPVATRSGAVFASVVDDAVLAAGRDVGQSLLADTVLVQDNLESVLTTEPPDLQNPSAAFDEQNARVIVVGTAAGTRQTWAFDGVNWSRLATDTGSQGALSVDAAHEVLLVGAAGGVERFTGSSWTSAVASGQINFGGSLAVGFDGALVVGAGTQAGHLSDVTWATDTPAPDSRSNPAISFLGQAASVASAAAALLFGGSSSNCDGGLCNDTWTFDGTQWTQEAPAVSPPPRASHVAAYDNRRGEVVLFGGNGADGALADTWAFRAGVWRDAAPAHAPPARFDGAFAADTVRGRLFFFGGIQGVSATHDLWEWRGGGGDRAAHIARIPFAASGAGGAVVEDVSARVVAAGHAAIGTAGGGTSPVDGVAVYQWVAGAWEELGENDAAAPAEIDATLTPSALLGDAQTLAVAVAERQPSGPFADRDDVETDYLEVSFHYRLP